MPEIEQISIEIVTAYYVTNYEFRRMVETFKAITMLFFIAVQLLKHVTYQPTVNPVRGRNMRVM